MENSQGMVGCGDMESAVEVTLWKTCVKSTTQIPVPHPQDSVHMRWSLDAQSVLGTIVFQAKEFELHHIVMRGHLRELTIESLLW